MSDLDSSSETPDTDSTAEDWPVLNDGCTDDTSRNRT